MGTGMNDGDHVGDLVSGYVLGTLDDQETLRVARHLPSCGFLGLFSGRALIAAGLAASILVVAGLTAVAVVLRQQRGVEALRSLEMPVFKLSGTQEMPGATALVVSSSTGDRGTLVVDGLPPLRGSRVYQLWLTRNGASVEGAAFTVDEEGYATVVVHAPRPLTDYTAFSVTMEPGSGSHAPTGPPLLRK
jgi:anti-sigma-K factor RskA